MYTYNHATLNNHVFHFLYGCAMHDAILQRSFTGEKKWVYKVPEAEKFVRDYIDRLLKGDLATEESHGACFLETANNVCAAINNSPLKEPGSDVFSFGNAQKLINITVKHVYALTYHDPSIREHFRYCHCPMDQIMLSKIWKAFGNSGTNKERNTKLGKNDYFNAAWGKEGTENGIQPVLTEYPTRYLVFQNAVKAMIGEGTVFPVEFDYLEWKAEEQD